MPARAGHALAIVGARANRAGHVGAVTVLVGWIGVGADPVPAPHVVDEAVAVVVHPVGLAPRAALPWVGPSRPREIRMVQEDPRVDHGHHRLRATRGDVPGGDGVDIRAWQAARLPGVLEAPLLPEERIARPHERAPIEVGLRVEDLVRALEGAFRGPGRLAPFHLDELQPAHRQRAVQLDLGPPANHGAVARVSGRGETHDQLAGRRAGLGLDRPGQQPAASISNEKTRTGM